jgi:hypothetical protein
MFSGSQEAMVTPGAIHPVTFAPPPAIAINITFSALNASDKID